MDRQQAIKNRLLAALPPGECDRLLPALEVVPLNHDDVLYTPGKRIRFVHFPTRGVLTTLVRMKDGRTAEAGIVGCEGMVCLSTFLDCDTTPFQTVVQNPGEALRMKADDFKAEVSRSEALHRLLHRYVDAFLCMVSQMVACKALHPLEERCARWLLMTLDRVQTDHFLLTQESLAQRLGVFRTSVSEVAHKFQEKGLIDYRRGKVTVLDRPGLEAACCECYGNVKAKFDALPGGPEPSR